MILKKNKQGPNHQEFHHFCKFCEGDRISQVSPFAPQIPPAEVSATHNLLYEFLDFFLIYVDRISHLACVFSLDIQGMHLK